jgi:hypothetical protein
MTLPGNPSRVTDAGSSPALVTTSLDDAVRDVRSGRLQRATIPSSAPEVTIKSDRHYLGSESELLFAWVKFRIGGVHCRMVVRTE